MKNNFTIKEKKVCYMRRRTNLLILLFITYITVKIWIRKTGPGNKLKNMGGNCIYCDCDIRVNEKFNELVSD